MALETHETLPAPKTRTDPTKLAGAYFLQAWRHPRRASRNTASRNQGSRHSWRRPHAAVKGRPRRPLNHLPREVPKPRSPTSIIQRRHHALRRVERIEKRRPRPWHRTRRLQRHPLTSPFVHPILPLPHVQLQRSNPSLALPRPLKLTSRHRSLHPILVHQHNHPRNRIHAPATIHPPVRRNKQTNHMHTCLSKQHQNAGPLSPTAALRIAIMLPERSTAARPAAATRKRSWFFRSSASAKTTCIHSRPSA